MADIFISYARPDRGRIEQLAAELEAEGYSVWWDRNIEAGAEFSADIEREIDAAKAVIVCWSADANKSPWVKDEASAARDAAKLIPVRLDGEQPPMGFRQYQALNLVDWRGNANAPEFEELSHAISVRLSNAPSITPVAPSQKPGVETNKKLVVLGGAILFTFVAAVLVFRGDRPAAPEITTKEDKAVESATTPQESELTENISLYDKSIAVLPFRNMSNDPEQEYFSDGVAEEILSALTRVDGLRVAGRTSSFVFKGQDENLPAIADTLKVAHVLGGSVRRQGDKVRIRAELVGTADGFQIWSETFERDLDDIFAIQDEIARAVADQMKVIVETGDRPLVARATDNEEAYQLFLQAQALFALLNRENLVLATELYHRAVALDPEFARAWASLANAYALSPWYLTAPVPELLERAETYAQRAIQLDSSLADPHAALGIVALVRTRFNEMRPHFEQAIELDPNNLLARQHFSAGLLSAGHPKEALEQVQAAIRIDPIHPNNYFWLGFIEFVNRNYDEAEIAAKQSLAIGFPVAKFVLAEVELARGNNAAARRYSTQAYFEGLGGTLSNAEYEILANASYGGNDQEIEAAGKFVGSYMNSHDVNRELVIPSTLLRAGRYDQMLDVVEASEAPLLDLFYRLPGPGMSEARQHPAVRKLLIEAGLIDYWKTYGWPEYCRPVEGGNPDAFECE